MKPFVLVAAAAMALASCQKNEIPAPEKQDVHFTINAGIETKTSIIETLEDDKTVYKAQWDGNEELGVLFAAPNAGTKDTDVVVLTNAESGSVASFKGTVTVDGPSGTFYAFYPAAAFNRGYGEGDARLDLKNVQKPTATSFDPSCDILVAKPYDYEVVDGEVVADGLEFARLMSVLRIDLKSEFAEVQNEFVESVSFTAGDVKITGYARIFLDNPVFTGNWASSGDQWCTVTANYDSDLVSINGTSNSVYLVIAPVTIPADKDLTFEIKTKNYNISKTIKSPEMKFTAGKVSKINLTIAADNCEKIDTSIDYSGEWLITGVKESQTYAVSAYVDGNNLDVLVPITVADEKITEVDGLANCKMTITKVLDGDYAGMYTIEDANSTEQKRSYLYAAGTGTNNYLKASSTLSAGSYWDITKNDNGTYTIIASEHSTERNTIWYNTGSNIFSCYQSNSTSYKPITLYPYSMVVPDTTPKLELEKQSIELTAAGGEGTIAVTAKNLPAEIQVRALTAEGAQDEVEWLTAAYADGVITYTAAANESTEVRTAYIEVYVSNELKTGISVTQEAEGATKQYYVKVTDEPSDWSGTYLMVCDSKEMALSGISTTSTKYGIGTEVDITDNKIEATDANAAWQVEISKASVTLGAYKMLFGGKYLYWTSSNSLTTNASEVKNANWNISITDGTLKIANCGTASRQIMWNASSPRFACYEGTQTAIQLYKLEDGSAGGETPEPEPEQLEMSAITCSAQTENSLTFTWTAVANATGYEVTCNNKTETVTTTQYVAANLAASTSYTISVVAKGNGTDYLDSEPKTQTGTTKEEQGDDAAETSYVKVTATPSDWSGTYLIVYESGATAYVYNGTDSGSKNYVSATISDNQIARSSAVDAVAVQIAKSGSGYSIKVPNGKYISGETSNGTTFNTSAVANTITLNTDGTVKINNNTTTSFQFNSASDQMRFRYFKSAQKSVYLYKLN